MRERVANTETITVFPFEKPFMDELRNIVQYLKLMMIDGGLLRHDERPVSDVVLQLGAMPRLISYNGAMK